MLAYIKYESFYKINASSIKSAMIIKLINSFLDLHFGTQKKNEISKLLPNLKFATNLWRLITGKDGRWKGWKTHLRLLKGPLPLEHERFEKGIKN